MTSTIEADQNCVTFRHQINFMIHGGLARRPFADRNETTFATVHGVAAYEWQLIWGYERSFNWRRQLPRRYLVELIAPSFTLVDRIAHPIDVTFHLTIVDQEDNEVLEPITETVTPLNAEDDPAFRLDESSLTVGLIMEARQLQANQYVEGRRLYANMATVLRLAARDFELLQEWNGTARPPPSPLDFRFALVSDRKLHDLTIHCEDGDVTASKTALFHSSIHFRSVLLQPTPVSEIREQSTRLAVDQTITFMLTETFWHEGAMSTGHAEKLIELMKKYGPLKRALMLAAIERHLLGQIEKKRKDLRYLLEHFLVGLKHGLDRLANAVMAVVYELHLNEYMMDFQAATRKNIEHHQLINELQARTGLFRPSPHSKLMSFCPLASNVQLIEYKMSKI